MRQEAEERGLGFRREGVGKARGLEKGRRLGEQEEREISIN